MPTLSTGPGAAEKTTFTFGSTAVPKILSITPPDVDRAMVDKTCLGDTIKSYRASTLIDVKELTIKVLYDSTDHQALLTAQSATTPTTAVLSFYDAGGTELQIFTWTSGAFVKSYKFDTASNDKNVECDIVFQFVVAPVVS